MALLQVRVVSPENVVFDEEASGLIVPAWDGKLGIHPGHAPMIALLGEGELVIRRPDGGKENMYVRRGVVRVERDQVMVLSEAASLAVPPGAEGTSIWLDLDEEGALDTGRGDGEGPDLSTPGNPLA